MKFVKASKKELRARVALLGPAGSGKTYSALAIAAALGKRVAVIDTEHGSASRYADAFDFDVLELESFAPAQYVEAIKAATGEGYEAVVIDSLSHAWMGKDGALEQVDRAAKRSQGNSFAAWRDITPQHNALVEALLGCSAHLIVTMRSKMEYVLEEDSRGKKVPRKVGMAPIQRDGLEYEFDLVGDMTLDHDLCVTKTRFSAFDNLVIRKPGRDFGEQITKYLAGEKVAPKQDRPSTIPPPAAAATFAQTFPNKKWAGKALGECADLEILKDYKVWLEVQLVDDRKKAKAKAALDALADEFAARIEREAAPDIADKLQQHIDKREAEPGGENDQNPEWGLSSPENQP